MLRYIWQNAGYDIGEPVDNFTSVIDVAFSNDIIECAVMTCDHNAFLHLRFVVIHIALSILLKVLIAFIVNTSVLRLAFTMTSAVTSRARLQVLQKNDTHQHIQRYIMVLLLKFHTYMFVRTQVHPLSQK